MGADWQGRLGGKLRDCSIQILILLWCVWVQKAVECAKKLESKPHTVVNISIKHTVYITVC